MRGQVPKIPCVWRPIWPLVISFTHWCCIWAKKFVTESSIFANPPKIFGIYHNAMSIYHNPHGMLLMFSCCTCEDANWISNILVMPFEDFVGLYLMREDKTMDWGQSVFNTSGLMWSQPIGGAIKLGYDVRSWLDTFRGPKVEVWLQIGLILWTR